MADCIFCKIAAGEMDTEMLYKDEDIVAFEDINPQAPTHILIIPRKHIATLDELKGDDYQLVGKIYQVANQLAAETDIIEDGYQIVANCKEDGGQVIYHIHFHLLGGRKLNWPPGE